MRSFILLLLVPAVAAAGQLSVSVESVLARGVPGVHAGPGQPRVEQVTATFILPPGADPGTLRLELSGTKTLPVAESLPASNGPIRVVGAPHSQAVREPFDSARPFPERRAVVASAGMMGDLPVVAVRLYPLQFHNGQARRIVSGSLTLTFAEGAPRSATLPPAGAWLLDRAVNGEQAAAWYAPRASSPRLVIFTSAALRRASQMLPAFAEAMTAAGWSVELLEVESFAGGAVGQARADAMRTQCVGAWLNGFTHLLLIGDPNPLTGDLPMKLVSPLQYELTHAVPTDLFYSDLSGDWDLNLDGHAGTFGWDGGPGGVDFLPELIVGRIPVYPGRTDQLDAYLRRLLYYKGRPQAPGRTVLLPHSVPFLPNESGQGEGMTDGAELGEELSRYELTPAGIPHLKLYEKEGLAPSPYPCDYPLTRENLLGLWRDEGVGAVIWYGHGAPDLVVRTMWTQDDGNRRPEVEKGEVEQEVFLASEDAWSVNPRTPAFVFAVACENGYTEREDNMAAAFLRTGSLAASAASRWAAVYGEETDFEGHGSATGIGYRFMKNALLGGMDAGSALGAARSDPAADFNHPYWWANVYDYNLYGDPTLNYAGGQLPAAHPEPSIYWVRTEPEGVSPCGDPVTLTVRGARPGEVLTVPGAQALGATVGEVEDDGAGLYSVQLDGARALGGRVVVPVGLGDGAGAGSLYRLPSRIFDAAGNVEGDPNFTPIVDIVEAESVLATGEMGLRLRLAGPLRPPSQFQGENFYAVIWYIDTDGDGWDDQSAHYYQYQADEWALYSLDPWNEQLEEAHFAREGDTLTIRVSPGYLPAGTASIRWRATAWAYSVRTGYTYQELGRQGALCVGGEPALEPAAVIPFAAGGPGAVGVGAVNLAAVPSPFAVVNPATGWGQWENVEPREGAFCPMTAPLGTALGIAGTAPGMTAYRQGTGPLSLSPLTGDPWAAGDALLLPIPGLLIAAGLDGFSAMLVAGGSTAVVPPGGMAELPLQVPGYLIVASGQGVAVRLRTPGGEVPLRPAPLGWTRGWFPGVAHIDGWGGSRWRSRLVLFNGTPDPSTVRLTFHSGGWEGEPRTIDLDLPPWQALQEEDILAGRFGGEGFGLLEVVSAVPLQGWVVTHLEDDSQGGQLILPLTDGNALGAGDAFLYPASLSGLREVLFLSNPGPEWMECLVDGHLVGLGPGRNVWIPVHSGTPVEVLKGRLFATLSVQDVQGNPAVLHLGAPNPW